MDNEKQRSIIPDVLGVCCSLIGTLVIFGWVFHSYFLIQLHGHFSPMHFNTALCFILGGLSLCFLNSNHKIISSYLSALLLLIAGITLCEYLFQVNLGIDELFFTSYISIVSYYPGRMAPNAALGFTVFALSSLILGLQSTSQWIKVHLAANFFILSIGLIAILRYCFHVTTHYGLGQWITMALHTAIGLIFLSLGLISYTTKKNYSLFIPFTVGFILLNCTFLLWQFTKLSQENHLNDILKTKIGNVSSLIETYLDERIASFNRISYRWLSQEGGTPESVWEKDVNHYIDDQPGYIAIEWVDNHYNVRWVMPKQNNEHTIGFNLYQDAHRRQELKKALETKTAQLSEELDLIQGGKGLLIFSPLLTQEQFLGFMVGVINTHQLFDSLIKKMDITGFQLTIKDKTGIMYDTLTDGVSDYPTWERKQTISIHGQRWEILIKPLPMLYNEIISPFIPWFTLLVGILLSVLSSILTASFLSINRLQKKARNANERLRGIIEGSTDYIAAIDLNYNFLVFNTMYKNEVYRLFKIDLKPGMNFNLLLEKMSTENQQRTKKLWEKALEGKSFTTSESFKDKVHEELSYEIHYNPIFDAEGILIGASHIATNIYQRIKDEQILISYQKQLEETNCNLEKQNNNLNLLKELSNILQTNNSESQAIESIGRYIKKLLVGTAGIIYLAHDNENFVRPVLHWGNIDLKQKEFGTDDCFALLRYQPYAVTNSSENIPCKHVEVNENKSLCYICLPLFVQKNILGLLYLEPDDSHSVQIDQQLLNFGQMVSNKIALNFYNIKLKESLRIQSIQDGLTGLYNRRYFEEFITKEMARAKRYSNKFTVLLLDIDHFKTINDTYGHQAGDAVLCQVSNILRKDFRESDLIARWGGEEFILILSEASLDIAYTKAEKLRHFIENHVIKMNNEKLTVTVSIGIAIFDGEADKDVLIKKADDALYQAKNTGRNKVVINAYDQLD